MLARVQRQLITMEWWNFQYVQVQMPLNILTFTQILLF